MTELLAAPWLAGLFAEAFTLWGAPTTWLELLAVALALAMVFCNIREVHWGWPLAIASSLLYFALFWRSKLYGEASLQIFFVAVSLWGWLQWLRGVSPDGGVLRVVRLSSKGQLGAALVALLLWPTTALFLLTYTDTDVPWWDALPTSLSLVGQYLLARKFLENWAVWVVVNIVSVALFAYKGLWPTVFLYALFVALSVLGWRAWRSKV